MALTLGTKLGPYEIQSPLGAGGMGEVYRARDTRLGREVAIKLLPAAFSRDPERLRRFKQEAQVVAALNHPNILAIHDFGEHEGSPYIVTELLEGQTLREWLGARAIPSRKATDAAGQVARGLAAAHDKGIVHRDLKPENIFITRDGRAKILDFGLAKLTPEKTPDAATLPSQTEPGVVMGTIGYMSPEQVRGVSADHRSDLFSLGAILYEMLSGKRAFHGETFADAASAILHSEPQELTETNQKISPALSRIVGHCLEKGPEARFQSAHDLVFDLEAVSETSASHSVIPASRSRRLSRLSIGIVVALAGLALVAVIVFVAQQRLARARVPALHQITFRRGTVWNARFAPDGKSVLYGAAWDGNPVEIFHSSLDSPDARPLGMTGADVSSILPNGEMAVMLRRQRNAGFSFNGMLARVPVAGGTPREILDRVESADGAPDGSLAVASHSQGKARLEFPIGTLRFESSTYIGDVRVSPKGDMVAFVEHDEPIGDSGVVRVVGPKGSQKLTRDYGGVQGLAWSVAGDKIWYTAADSGGSSRNLHVVDLYGHDRLIYRVPGTLRVQDVAKDGRILLVHEAARAGILAHAPGSSGERELGWLDWSICRSLSDDGKRLLFDESGDAPGDQTWIYLRETDGSPPLRLGQGSYSDLSPDGKWVAAVPSDFSDHNIHIIPTGAGRERTFEVQNKKLFSVSWVPNGKQLLLRAAAPGEALRGYVFDLETAVLQPVTPEGVRPTGPVSRDGKFIAGTRPDGTAWLFPIGGGSPRPIAVHAPEGVVDWSSDSKAVYVASAGETAVNVYRVEIDTGKRSLFTILSPSDKAGLTYTALCSVTPDGKFYTYCYNRQLSELFIVEGLE